MKEESLTNKIIILSILIIPFIIYIVCTSGYKDLGYNPGEFTGYTLEIKCNKQYIRYNSEYEEKHSSSKVKQLYNIKESDYITSSLGKNNEQTVDNLYSLLSPMPDSPNIIFRIKQLSENHATIILLKSSGNEEVSLKYGESYEFTYTEFKAFTNMHSTYKYKIKFQKVEA